MTVNEWIGERTPRPPDALRERILQRLDADGAAEATSARAVCASAAIRTITEVISGSTGARDSAIDLLAADALITYAIEAAVEARDFPDQVSVMVRELAAVAADA